MKEKLKFKVPHWKTIFILLLAIILIVAVVYAVKYFEKDEEGVPFTVLSENEIPQKIQEILPRYKSLERALACKADDKIYVIVTRGEKPTGGYTVGLDALEMKKEENKKILIVHARFKDPEPGDIVTQVITYPYVAAETNLKELPDKIELKVQYDD